MQPAGPTQTTLGPGQQIMDQTLLTHIKNAPALSPTDILKIARFYQGNDNDLANQLFLIALTMTTRDQVTKPPSPSLSPPPPSGAASPNNEWSDQFEDFLNGNIDSEDGGTTFRGTSGQLLDIRWFPFSTSLPGFGLLIASYTSLFGGPAYYVIGLSPDVNSLPAE